MSMRLRVVQKRDEIVKGEEGVVDTSPDAVNTQLENLHDAMIDIHKEFVSSEEASQDYIDFFNIITDQTYVSENRDKELFATLKEAYRHPEGGFIILPMLTKVWVKMITPTGLVTFAPVNEPQRSYRLYADELRNFRFEK